MRGLSIAALVVAVLLVAASAGAMPQASGVVVVGAEHDVAGFNTEAPCCTDPWSSWMGTEEAIRGAFDQTANGGWIEDLVSSAVANRTGISYTIKSNANWYWGGRKVPVTYRDFVYTLRELDDPNNQPADRSGYANLDPTRYTHVGLKQVRFFWRTQGCNAAFPCGPYGDWQRLFSIVYPSFALRGVAFDDIWTSCICGTDGRPVADGPYYLASYTKGQGSLLLADPFWAGRKPTVRQIEFRVLGSVDAEVQALESGTVDAIAPTFGQNLVPLRNQTGKTFSQVPGHTIELLVFREGPGASNVLLRAPFIRESMAMAIDRQALINIVFGDFAQAGIVPLNSALFYATERGYKQDFERWNYNPSKALSVLRKHCTGGPDSVDPANTSVWTCAGLPASFTWSWPVGDSEAALTEAIAKVELQAVGIAVVDRPEPPDMFYGPGGIASGGFDVAEFPASIGDDPGDWNETYRCGGATNVTGFCSHAVDRLLLAAASETDPVRRRKDFQQADILLSKSVPVVPLFQRPDVLVHTSTLLGMVNSPGTAGPFGNAEDWSRKR